MPPYPMPMGYPQMMPMPMPMQGGYMPPTQIPVQERPIPPPALEVLPNEKDLLGERLYPLVEKKNPEYASKITGMLLEMEVEQIQNIIRDQNQLDKWIAEALKVTN